MLAVLVGLFAVWVVRLNGDGGRSRFAPLFSLPDQAGRVHRMEDYRGRPVVLLFFGPLDEASKQGLLDVQKRMGEFDRTGIRMFGVGSDAQEPLREFHDGKLLDFPLLSDPAGEVARSYRLKADGSGRLRGAVIVGARGTIMERIERLQLERLGEQVMTMAACCMMPSRQSLVRAVGTKVAPLSLPDAATGKPRPLFEAGSRATLLLFISARCPCSKAYDTRMRELAGLYAKQGLRIVGVYSAADEPREEAAAHSRGAAFPFPTFWDPAGKLLGQLHAIVTPEAFVLDRKGVVQYQGRVDDSRHPEEVRVHDVRNALEAVLAGHRPPRPFVQAFGCAIVRAAPSPSSPSSPSSSSSPINTGSGG